MHAKRTLPLGVAIATLVIWATSCQNESGPPDTSNDSDSHNGSDSDEDSGGDTGTGQHWASCDLTSQCFLAANSCCGVCGAPTIDDVDGVNAQKRDEHFAEVCDEPDTQCPGCPSALNPELVATCDDDGMCAAVDLGATPLTECSASTDCVIRTPECCECGADTNAYALIALRADQIGELRKLVCDPDAVCPTCAPVYPENAKAVCDDDGHCAVITESPPTKK